MKVKEIIDIDSLVKEYFVRLLESQHDGVFQGQRFFQWYVNEQMFSFHHHHHSFL